jgi:hypothetical protein
MNKPLRMSEILLLAALLVSVMALAQQRPEPATPTLQETSDYIAMHLALSNFHWSGTTIEHQGEQVNIRFDAMDIDYARLASAGSFNIVCKRSARCISKTGSDGVVWDATSNWDCENAAICPNVVNAMNHFIKLLQQQNIPQNDPFAPR